MYWSTANKGLQMWWVHRMTSNRPLSILLESLSGGDIPPIGCTLNSGNQSNCTLWSTSCPFEKDSSHEFDVTTSLPVSLKGGGEQTLQIEETSANAIEIWDSNFMKLLFRTCRISDSHEYCYKTNLCEAFKAKVWCADITTAFSWQPQDVPYPYLNFLSQLLHQVDDNDHNKED